MKRIAIYVDGQDIFRAAWHLGPRYGLHSAKPDYEAILGEACTAAREAFGTDEVNIARAIVYSVAKHSARKFTKALVIAGFEVEIHILRQPGACAKCGSRNDKFSWRTRIACDAICDVIPYGLDGVVLVTGSPEMAPVGRAIQSLDCEVVSLGFPGRTSTKLINVRYLTDRCLYGEPFVEGRP